MNGSRPGVETGTRSALVVVFELNRLRLTPSAGLGAPYVDGGRADHVLDVRGIVFLDHLDAGAAITGDGIHVRPLHQAETNIGMAKRISGARLTIAIELEIGLVENAVEELHVIAGEHLVVWLGQFGQGRLRRFCDPLQLAAPTLSACFALNRLGTSK